MVVGLLGSSGHMGIKTLEEFLKIPEVDVVKVLLEKNECATVLYNSWETDWTNNPFIAILEEIKEEIDLLSKSKKSFMVESAIKTWRYVSSAFVALGKELLNNTFLGPQSSCVLLMQQ